MLTVFIFLNVLVVNAVVEHLVAVNSLEVGEEVYQAEAN
jgi:hypothetical protein